MKLFAICLFPVTVINAIIVQMSFEMEEIDQLFKYDKDNFGEVTCMHNFIKILFISNLFAYKL